MFEKGKSESGFNPWKLLPVVAAVILVIAAGVYFLAPGPPAPPGEVEGVIRQGDPEFERFSESIRVENTNISMAANFSGGETVVASGAILNLTTRTLDAVEVVVAFYNYEEKVGEAVRMPLHPETSQPLKPQQEIGFTLGVEDFPEDWMKAHAELHVRGFRFQEQPQPIE